MSDPNKNILLIGAGGHAISCIEVLQSSHFYNIFGLVDMSKKNINIGDYKILGDDNDAKEIFESCKNALITVGQIKSSRVRINLFTKYKGIGFKFPLIFSKTSVISKNTRIGEGTIMMHKVFVNSNVKIGKNCIINTASILEHDVNISDFCHVSTGAILNGNVKVGKSSFIGSGAIIANNVNIGNNVIISAGIFINENIKDNSIVK